MSLDPLISGYLAHATEVIGAIDTTGFSVAELRTAMDGAGNELFKEVAEDGPEVASVETLDAGGVKVKLYRPLTEGPHGIYVLVHGGGWWQSSIEDWICDVQARERCAGADCLVATVEYRLAPEHPFPAGLEDCYTAMAWLQDNASALGFDPARIVLGGVSAGGNLAAALTLLLRDRGRPQPALTVFEAAVMDFSLDYPSFRDYGTGYGLETAAFPGMIAMYLTDPGDAANPYASPVRAASFDGLGPAHFLVGEFDPVKDTSAAYAAKLAAAGIPATLSEHAGQIHQSPVMTKVLPAARAWRDEVHSVVAAAVRAGVPA